MITADTRVSDALAAHPELRERLPAFHPAFGKLTHPVLGKILPRLVTVAEAARVAGVDVDALVAVMNLPSGAPLPAAVPGPAPVATPAPDWVDPARVVELDVRPLLGQGVDPLGVILAALRALPDGGQLRVLAPFEPVPLIGLLRRQGWRSWSAWSEGTCAVVFGRDAGGPVEGVVGPNPGACRRGDGWTIDVRGLEPPEPMNRVLAAVDAAQLPLRIVHEREPALLFPQLDRRGLRWEIGREGEAVHIDVRRP